MGIGETTNKTLRKLFTITIIKKIRDDFFIKFSILYSGQAKEIQEFFIIKMCRHEIQIQTNNESPMLKIDKKIIILSTFN